MPCLEENRKSRAVQSLEDEPQQSVEQEQTQPARVITQTDVLNNRLLKSFLNRMNTGDVAQKFDNLSDNGPASSEFDD